MGYASVGSVSIGGPYSVLGVARDTPSRRAIFVCEPRRESDERACATRFCRESPGWPIAVPRRRRTCRRCSSSSRAAGAKAASFDAGIQFALERVLVDPDFLLRVYRDPVGTRGSAAQRIR